MRFDDGSSMRLYRQTVEDFSLYSGLELNKEQMDALRVAAGKMSAKMRAVRIVSASSVSQKDLEQRLIHKGESPEDAKQAVAWMTELDLVDDRKTAQQIVQRCAAKGYGMARAKQVLYEKRIPKSYWQEALEDYPEQTDSIVAFLRSKITDPQDRRQLQKAIDALLRRGHAYPQIRRALELISVDTEEFPEG